MDSSRTIQRAYKTELDPTKAQVESMERHIRACRFLYNLALERCITGYELSRAAGRSFRLPTAFDLNRELTQLKQSECPWLYDVSNEALQFELRHLQSAYANFFRRMAEGKKGRRAGFPRFKSRKLDRQSYKVVQVRVTGSTISLPRIGQVRLKERGYLPTSDVRITSAAVSREAGRWFVSIQVEQQIPVVRVQGPAIGVDLGLAHLATLSDGTVIENPRALRVHERKLRRLQKSVSRKQKGSCNREKAKARLARQHAHVSNIRRHTAHEATSAIAKRYGTVVVESLNVAGMVRNHHLAKSVSDAGMGEFLRQLAYKCDWYGSRLIAVDRFFPSTKLCARCGGLKEMPLSERMYRCECGWVCDRDLNAALNLYNVAAKSSETVNACGEFVSPAGDGGQGSVKQESTHVYQAALPLGLSQ